MLDYLGMYSCEFRVTLASGQILKFSDIRLFSFSKFSVAKYNQTRTYRKSLVKALRQGAVKVISLCSSCGKIITNLLNQAEKKLVKISNIILPQS